MRYLVQANHQHPHQDTKQRIVGTNLLAYQDTNLSQAKTNVSSNSANAPQCMNL